MKLRVPGKIMLAGEYAVLDGCRSLAFTVNKYLEVDAKKSDKNAHLVASTIWDKDIEISSSSFEKNPLTDAVFHASNGNYFDVKVDSELRIEDGMGSSSALRLAVFSALSNSEKKSTKVHTWSEALDIAQAAYSRQLVDQGSASGYDIITQLFGGLVVMTKSKDKWPEKAFSLEAVDFNDWIHVIVGGKGAPTGSQMGSTSTWLKENNLWESLKRRASNLWMSLFRF